MHFFTDVSGGTTSITFSESVNVVVRSTFDLVSGVTFNPETSRITMQSADVETPVTFNGSGHTFYNVEFDSGLYEVHGSNTYQEFLMYVNCFITFDAGSTHTFDSFFSLGEGGGNALSSSSPGTFYTFVDTSGTNEAQYTTITDSHATGGATWDATLGSTDGGGNTGWDFGVTTKFIPWLTQDVMA
jgi:hypothetical protein